MSAPVTQAEREAWLTRAEHDLAAMRAYADGLERRFAAFVNEYGQLATVAETSAGCMQAKKALTPLDAPRAENSHERVGGSNA